MARLNISLTRFFGLSLAIHGAVFSYLILAQRLRSSTRPEPAPIAVSLLPPAEKAAASSTAAPATQISKTPATVAKKDSSRAGEKLAPRPNQVRNSERSTKASVEKVAKAKQDNSPAERLRDEHPAGLPVPANAPTQRELPIEKSVVAERQLPTVKELLPPLTYSSAGGSGSAPVSLNTKDPAYVNYFNRIKQSIEVNWEYPELAKRYGLQGKLALEFIVGADGQLERLRIVRSSGSQLLDDEALRAIKAAAPFPRIPPWIKGNPLLISATMEYSDSRLNYRETR